MDIEKDQDVKLNGLVTVVNALKASKQMKAFGEFFNNQIEYATTVVLSRTQKASEAQLELCVKQIQELNAKAAIITTPWDELSGETILQTMENQNSLQDILMKEADICPECGHHHEHGEHCHHHEHHHGHGEHCHHDDHACSCGHHHHHHADEVFTSLGKETVHTYTQEQLDKILQTLSSSHEYGDILRAKGILPTSNQKWLHFDLVPGEYEIRFGPADYTGRICVIGKDLAEDKICQLFGVEQ